MRQKIASLTIEVPYKSSGGVIHQHNIAFELYEDAGQYSLKPCIDLPERNVANLPEELNFELKEGKPVSSRGIKDGNFHIIEAAVAQLRLAAK